MRKLTHVKLRVICDRLSLALPAPQMQTWRSTKTIGSPEVQLRRPLRDRLLTALLLSLAAQKLLDIEYRKYPFLELTFDDGNQKRFVDLRPLIPIVLRF